MLATFQSAMYSMFSNLVFSSSVRKRGWGCQGGWRSPTFEVVSQVCGGSFAQDQYYEDQVDLKGHLK